MTRVRVFHNQNTLAMIPGQPPRDPLSDPLRLVDDFEVDAEKIAGRHPDVNGRVLEHVFRIHNAVDGSERNVKLGVRSLSVGDVVEVEGTRYRCAALGWERVDEALR